MKKVFRDMKKTLLSSCAATLALLAASCGGAGQRDGEGFPQAELLAADSVAIAEVLQPQSFIVSGEHAVLFSPQTSKVLWRYRLPDWTLADSSFVQGGGPDDFGAYVSFLKTNDPSRPVFWLNDVMRRRSIRFDQSGGNLVKTDAADYYIPGGAQSIVLGDTLLAYQWTRQDALSSFRIAALRDTLAVLDSVPGYSMTKMDIRQEGGKIQSISVRSYNSVRTAVHGDRIVLWYPGTRNLQVYRVKENGSLESLGEYGDAPLDAAAVNAYVARAKEAGYSEDDLTLLAADDSCLYFLEKTRGAEASSPSNGAPQVEQMDIKVYDWTMKPVKKYRLDHPSAQRVLPDIENGKVYAWDPRTDFEQVYVYTL